MTRRMMWIGLICLSVSSPALHAQSGRQDKSSELRKKKRKRRQDNSWKRKPDQDAYLKGLKKKRQQRLRRLDEERRLEGSRNSTNVGDYNLGFGAALGAGILSGVNLLKTMEGHSYLQSQIGITVFTGKLSTSLDYVFYFPDTLGAVVPYFGIGGNFLYGSSYASLISDSDAGTMYFGGQAPLGVHFILSELPLMLFGEAVPGLLILPETKPIFGILLGFRWLI